jgi:putative ABC transport system permease protein
MARLQIILKSITKQGMKFKLVFFQLVLIFISLNFAFTLVNKNLELKNGIDEFINKDESVMLKLSVNSSDKDPLNSINKIYQEISQNELVDKIGSFDMGTIKIKEKKSNVIYLNRDAFDLYNIKTSKGTSDIFHYKKNQDEIPIIVSEDLSESLGIDTTFSTETLKNNKLEKLNYKVIGIIDSNSVFWNSKNGGQPSLNKLKNSIIIPFDKQYYYDDGINFSMKSQHTIVSVKKKEELNQFESDFLKLTNKNSRNEYIEVNELITRIYEESKPWIVLSLSFVALLSILSLIGFMGILTSYITFRKREYGIRFALGSTSKELSRLVCGEVLLALLITNLISIIPIIILTYILGMDLKITFIMKSVCPSFIISIAILSITFYIYKLFILKKNIVDLIRGN